MKDINSELKYWKHLNSEPKYCKDCKYFAVINQKVLYMDVNIADFLCELEARKNPTGELFKTKEAMCWRKNKNNDCKDFVPCSLLQKILRS